MSPLGTFLPIAYTQLIGKFWPKAVIGPIPFQRLLSSRLGIERSVEYSILSLRFNLQTHHINQLFGTEIKQRPTVDEKCRCLAYSYSFYILGILDE